MEKICLWLNFPSIHQTPLIRALAARGDVDVQVRYFDRSKALEDRRAQGWEAPALEPYERFADEGSALARVPEFGARVHVLPGVQHPFCRALLDAFEKEGIDWCHWGERTGIRFSSFVLGHPGVLRWVLPTLNRAFRRNYARRINDSSLGVFAIGTLAEEDFISWGVRKDLLRHLYYSTADASATIPDGEERSQFGGSPPTFIYVGSLCRRKATGLLLRAFSALRGKNWSLIVVGKDLSEGRYQSLARRLGIAERVAWIGPVPSAEVSAWLHRADVVILPSLFDGWGAVLNEGASAGKALISTTQCGAAWHLVVPGANGFRVPAGSVQALMEAILAYLQDPGLAKVHGKASRDLYLREFTASRNAERLVAALREWRERRQGERRPNA